jgi:hypothetical protein
VPPRGPILDVELRWTDRAGRPRAARPHQWIKNARDNQPYPADIALVFGGSRFVTPAPQGPAAPQQPPRELYQADLDGTLIALATFGTDTIGPARVFSPDASVDQPQWIADAASVPTIGTKVVVRLRPTGAWFGAKDAPTPPASATTPSGSSAPIPPPPPPARTFENVPR